MSYSNFYIKKFTEKKNKIKWDREGNKNHRNLV